MLGEEEEEEEANDEKPWREKSIVSRAAVQVAQSWLPKSVVVGHQMTFGQFCGVPAAMVCFAFTNEERQELFSTMYPQLPRVKFRSLTSIPSSLVLSASTTQRTYLAWRSSVSFHPIVS